LTILADTLFISSGKDWFSVEGTLVSAASILLRHGYVNFSSFNKDVCHSVFSHFSVWKNPTFLKNSLDFLWLYTEIISKFLTLVQRNSGEPISCSKWSGCDLSLPTYLAHFWCY
jgi:hypothetical protein